MEIEQLKEVKSANLDDNTFVEGDFNVVNFNPPMLSGNQIIKGLGGKYLDQVTKTTVFNTTSGTYTNVTDLTITKNISKRRVLLTFSGDIKSNADDQQVYLTFDIDGTSQGDLIVAMTKWTTASILSFPVHMSFATSLLTGSHTFKVQMKVDAGTGSMCNYGKAVFSIIELAD